MMNDSFCRIIAGEIQARPEQVDAAVRLLDEGNTVPFIARYRKEITGGLDDTQLRNLETRLSYLRELEERRQAILKSISEQGKLTDDLAKAINATLSKTELEDLYRRNEGVLQLSLNADPQFDEPPKESYCEQIIMDHLGLRLNNAPADSWRKGVVSWTWRIKVLMHLETELMGTVRERAEDEAINVFARNLHDLLMAAPAGLRATMGLDPGLRTGVKVAVVDEKQR